MAIYIGSVGFLLKVTSGQGSRGDLEANETCFDSRETFQSVWIFLQVINNLVSPPSPKRRSTWKNWLNKYLLHLVLCHSFFKLSSNDQYCRIGKASKWWLNLAWQLAKSKLCRQLSSFSHFVTFWWRFFASIHERQINFMHFSNARELQALVYQFAAIFLLPFAKAIRKTTKRLNLLCVLCVDKAKTRLMVVYK